ncbi:MAG TPA: hypothetical protein VMT05_09680 [Terriglobales bacterium]|nr:hypothetical protein [Terriglobales bacterium]
MAVFVMFLVHKPACSSSNRLHNQPVAKFKALTVDTDAKSGIRAMVEFAVIRPAEALVSPPVEGFVAADNVPMLAVQHPQVLSCSFLC